MLALSGANDVKNGHDGRMIVNIQSYKWRKIVINFSHHTPESSLIFSFYQMIYCYNNLLQPSLRLHLLRIDNPRPSGMDEK